MAWIESNQTLLHHPKTSRMARLLGIQRVHAVGHLHALWYFGLDHAQQGDLSRYDAFDLAAAAEWDGDPQLFTDAIVSAGFIDRSEDGSLCLHDWYDYAGKLIERRRTDAERKRDYRSQASSSPSDNGVYKECLPDLSETSGSVQGTSNGQRAESVVTETVPKPYRNHTVSKEITSPSVNDADVARAREESPQPPPVEKPTTAATLQTVQVTLSTEDRAAFDALVPLFPSGNPPVTEQTLLALLAAYPAVDLVAEARKCVQHRQDRQLTAATAATFDRWVRQAKFPLEQRHTARGHPTLAIVPKPCIIPNRWQVTAPKYARVLGDNAHTQGNRAEERRVAAEEQGDSEATAKASEQRDRYWRDRDELDRLAEEMDAAVAS